MGLATEISKSVNRMIMRLLSAYATSGSRNLRPHRPPSARAALRVSDFHSIWQGHAAKGRKHC